MAWHCVARESDIDDDCAIGVEVGATQIALIRSGGAIYATGNVCTHQYALMSDGYVEDGCIECPLHQGRFDVASGKALGAPVTEDLKTYPVKVEDGGVYVQCE